MRIFSNQSSSFMHKTLFCVFGIVFSFSLYTFAGCTPIKENISPDAKYAEKNKKEIEAEKEFTKNTSESEKNQSKEVLANNPIEILKTAVDSTMDSPLSDSTSINKTRVDERIFQTIEQAFTLRDKEKFNQLKTVFKQSFPKSPRNANINTLEQEFFYAALINIQSLRSTIVQIEYPSYRNWTELEEHFQRLSDSGINGIQWTVTQALGKPVFLFGKRHLNTGLFFNSPKMPIVDDNLKRVIEIAHNKGLLLYVTFPLRNHPWLIESRFELLDEAWDPLQNTNMMITKLDLINPDSLDYFKNVLGSLLSYGPDGVIFEDDYTYDIHEGFSKSSQRIYYREKQRKLVAKEFINPFPNQKNTRYDLFIEEKFEPLAKWRAGKIHDFLYHVLEFVQVNYPDIKVALETTSNMFLSKDIANLWYSTSKIQLIGLPFDHLILNWRKGNQVFGIDYIHYKETALILAQLLEEKQRIIVKAPLNNMTKNPVNLNDTTDKIRTLMDQIDNAGVLVGPINRLQDYKLLN